MTKICSILFILLTIIFLSPTFTLADIGKYIDGTFYFYTYEPFFSTDATTIKNGMGYIISTESKNAKTVYSALNKSSIKGMSLEFESDDFDLEKFIEKFEIEVKSIEKLENFTFFYGFSPLFDDFVNLDNENINIQMAIKSNTIHIGVPLILGSI